MRIHRVYLKGLELNIPPREQWQQQSGFKREKIKIYVDEFVSEQARLVINTLRSDKLPIEFAISNLHMKEIGAGQPLLFDATLVNPKPVEPFTRQADNSRSSSVLGKYSFTNADLSTIKGIAGILSSSGEYAGTLGNIVVDGETDTPDFRIASSDRPVPLHTEFHAIVDGTSGHTYRKQRSHCTVLLPDTRLMMSTTTAKTSSRWMRLPATLKPKPSSHNINRTAKIVQSTGHPSLGCR
jgi:hypothetical protein